MTDLEAIKARYPSVALAAPALIAEIESLIAERDRLREALAKARAARAYGGEVLGWSDKTRQFWLNEAKAFMDLGEQP